MKIRVLEMYVSGGYLSSIGSKGMDSQKANSSQNLEEQKIFLGQNIKNLENLIYSHHQFTKEKGLYSHKRKKSSTGKLCFLDLFGQQTGQHHQLLRNLDLVNFSAALPFFMLVIQQMTYTWGPADS